MITMRSVGMAAMMALVLALGTTPALAQSDEPGTAPSDPGTLPDDQIAVAVNGTSTLVGQADPGTTTVDGSIVRVRDNVLLTVERSSDPRVSGRATISVNFDAYPDPSGLPGATQVRFGSMRLENEDGAWSGRFAGTLANGSFVQTYWLAGEGAYEGLSYVVTAGGNGNVWRSQGLIYPGDIPPMGGSPSLPDVGPQLELPTA